MAFQEGSQPNHLLRGVSRPFAGQQVSFEALEIPKAT